MATFITIPAGQYPFSYLGANTLSLSGQPWYTTNNINKIFAVNGTRKGYVSGQPGNGFGTTQLLPPATGQPLNGYVLDVKTAFQVDASLFGAAPVGTPPAMSQLDIPTGRQATATSQTSLSVVASSVANATGYQLYTSATQSGTYTKLGGVLNSPSYAHSGLSAAQTYWYEWQAIGDGVGFSNSNLSAPFSGTTNRPPAPVTSAYYVSPTGSGSGASANDPIGWPAFQQLAPATGRGIYLQRGGVYPGVISALTNTTLGAFGTGDNPILDGTIASNTLTWTQESNGIWSAPLTKRVGRVFLNGVRQRLASRNLSTNGTTGNGVIQLTDLTGLGDWVLNAEVIARAWQWRNCWYTITSYNAAASTLTIDRAINVNFLPDFRLVNHKNVISAAGDYAWHENRVYYRPAGNTSPATLNLAIATQEAGLLLADSATNCSVSGVDFFGQVYDGIYGTNNGNFTASGCTFREQLTTGISLMRNCESPTITNCKFYGQGSNGVMGQRWFNYTISNNYVTGCGMGTELGFNRQWFTQTNARYGPLLGEHVAHAIIIGGGSYSGEVFQNDVLDNAYLGIRAHSYGTNRRVRIYKNRVRRFNQVMGDGGGIYFGCNQAAFQKMVNEGTLDQAEVWPVDQNVEVFQNEVSYGTHDAHGIYQDNGSEKALIYNNSCHDNNLSGIFSNYYTRNSEIMYNCIYANGAQQVRFGAQMGYAGEVGVFVTEAHKLHDNLLVGYDNAILIGLDHQDGSFPPTWSPFANGGYVSGNCFVAMGSNKNIVTRFNQVNQNYTLSAAIDTFGTNATYPVGYLDAVTSPSVLFYDFNDTLVTRQSAAPTNYRPLLNQITPFTLLPYNTYVFAPASVPAGDGGGGGTPTNLPPIANSVSFQTPAVNVLLSTNNRQGVTAYRSDNTVAPYMAYAIGAQAIGPVDNGVAGTLTLPDNSTSGTVEWYISQAGDGKSIAVHMQQDSFTLIDERANTSQTIALAMGNRGPITVDCSATSTVVSYNGGSQTLSGSQFPAKIQLYCISKDYSGIENASLVGANLVTATPGKTAMPVSGAAANNFFVFKSPAAKASLDTTSQGGAYIVGNPGGDYSSYGYGYNKLGAPSSGTLLGTLGIPAGSHSGTVELYAASNGTSGSAVGITLNDTTYQLIDQPSGASLAVVASAKPAIFFDFYTDKTIVRVAGQPDVQLSAVPANVSFQVFLLSAGANIYNMTLVGSNLLT